MPTLKQYFDTDFNRIPNIAQPMDIHADKEKLSIPARVHIDFDSNVKFISCYIPSCRSPIGICAALLTNLSKLLDISTGIIVQTKLPGETAMELQKLLFSGRVFFYSEKEIPEAKFSALQEQALKNGLHIHYRGPNYAIERTKLEKPLAFIAHDSRDKESVARPIAYALIKLMCPVWFDEFTLKVGERLRESIEKGIKECKKCILILTPNFLSNTGWTKVEFNSVFTREILEKENIVLPVWKDVGSSEIYNYCPALADRVGVNWDLGQEKVVRKLHRAIL